MIASGLCFGCTVVKERRGRRIGDIWKYKWSSLRTDENECTNWSRRKEWDYDLVTLLKIRIIY